MNKKITALGIAIGLILSGGAPALAAPAAPKAGAACTQSGQVIALAKTTSYCQVSGTKLVWSKPLPVSKANLTMADAWVKSVDKESMMTGAFGTLINSSSKPVKIVAAYASASVSKFSQLHEMVMLDGSMKMQEKSGGFVIPAKGKLQLMPGGNHTMVMGLTANIEAGSIQKITYVTSTGARFTQPFLAKFFAGGNETYIETPANSASVVFKGTGTGQAADVTITNPLFRKPDSMMAVFDSTGKTYKTGGFMVITNNGKSDVTLVGGTSDFGTITSVDETVGTNQWTVMKDGLTIGAGKSLKLRMKGYHITISGIPMDVPAGKKINVSLKFSDGSTLDTTFKIINIPSTDPTYGFATN